MSDVCRERPSFGRTFVALCYQVLLGRELDSDGVAEERGQWPVNEILQSFLSSEEFGEAVLFPLRAAIPFSGHLFPTRPGPVHRFWITECLPLGAGTAESVRAASTWRELLSVLVADEAFMRAGGAEPVKGLPDPWLADLVEDPDEEDATDYRTLAILGAADPETLWR